MGLLISNKCYEGVNQLDNDRKQEIQTKLKELNKTKYDWEFSGVAEERMNWLNREIKSYEELLEAILMPQDDSVIKCNLCGATSTTWQQFDNERKIGLWFVTITSDGFTWEYGHDCKKHLELMDG
jgi:ubiquitin C-terminal hydrolase